MSKHLAAVWVLDIQIDRDEVSLLVILQDVLDGDAPGSLVHLPILPPFQKRRKLLVLQWHRLGVVLPAFGKGLLVIPDLLGWAGPVEEEEVCGNIGVGGEDAVWKPDDGVEVELLEKLLLDPGSHSVPEERPVGYDHRGSARFWLPPELSHNQLEE